MMKIIALVALFFAISSLGKTAQKNPLLELSQMTGYVDLYHDPEVLPQIERFVEAIKRWPQDFLWEKFASINHFYDRKYDHTHFVFASLKPGKEPFLNFYIKGKTLVIHLGSDPADSTHGWVSIPEIQEKILNWLLDQTSWNDYSFNYLMLTGTRHHLAGQLVLNDPFSCTPYLLAPGEMLKEVDPSYNAKCNHELTLGGTSSNAQLELDHVIRCQPLFFLEDGNPPSEFIIPAEHHSLSVISFARKELTETMRASIHFIWKLVEPTNAFTGLECSAWSSLRYPKVVYQSNVVPEYEVPHFPLNFTQRPSRLYQVSTRNRHWYNQDSYRRLTKYHGGRNALEFVAYLLQEDHRKGWLSPNKFRPNYIELH